MADTRNTAANLHRAHLVLGDDEVARWRTSWAALLGAAERASAIGMPVQVDGTVLGCRVVVQPPEPAQVAAGAAPGSEV